MNLIPETGNFVLPTEVLTSSLPLDQLGLLAVVVCFVQVLERGGHKSREASRLADTISDVSNKPSMDRLVQHGIIQSSYDKELKTVKFKLDLDKIPQR